MITDLKLQNKIILMTGSAGSLGSSLGEELVRQGASLILIARTLDQLERLDDRFRPLLTSNQSLTLVPLNLEATDHFAHLAQELAKRYGHIDALIGCAASLKGLAPITDWDLRDWRTQFLLNLESPFLLLKALDPLLKKSPSGRVVFISDAILDEPSAYWGAYAISKTALEKMVEIYAEESKGTQVRANILRPEDYCSSLKSAIYPQENRTSLVHKKDMIHAILHLLDSRTDITGHVIKIKAQA